MPHPIFRSATQGLLLLLLATALGAAEPAGSADARLRDLLRATTMQLRTSEEEKAALQSAQAESAQRNKELTEQVKILIRQNTVEKAALEKTVAELNARASLQGAQLTQLREEFERAKAAGEKAAEAARASERENARLATTVPALQRRIADLEAKNLALFKLGGEILGRYEKFSLGEALRAKEPFVGQTRVKLENLVQDYRDKLLDKKMSP